MTRTQQGTPARIRLRFPDEGVEASAVLLEDEAPALSEAIRAILPICGMAHHAVYSGSEVAMNLDPRLMLPPSNQTLCALPGDVAFYCLNGGLWQGFPEDLSEVLVVYDRDGLPSMPWGPVPICLFACIDHGLDAFAAVCRRMRTEPHKRLEIVAEDS